jgi:serine/threonine protein kinase
MSLSSPRMVRAGIVWTLITIVVQFNSHEGEVWKLTDYYATYAGYVPEEPQYVAPEIIMGAREDLANNRNKLCTWSLACLLYEMSTGLPTFPDLNSAIETNSQSDRPRRAVVTGCNNLFAFSRTLSENEHAQVSEMWDSLSSDGFIKRSLLGQNSAGSLQHVENFRLSRINALLTSGLHRLLAHRPTVEEVWTVSAANLVFTSLQDDEVIPFVR